MGFELRLRRSAPDEVLDAVVGKLEAVGLAIEGKPELHDLWIQVVGAMMSVGIEAQRLRDEGWAPSVKP